MGTVLKQFVKLFVKFMFYQLKNDGTTKKEKSLNLERVNKYRNIINK